MRRLLTGCVIVAAALFSARTDAAPILTLLPPNGSVEAAPGETIGWGYEITNDDPTEWLVIASLTTDGFQYGTGSDLIFSYPIVAPDTTLSAPYLSGIQGLYEFTWDLTAPAGFVNTGFFHIGAELWDGDPFLGGSFVESLPDFVETYAVGVPSQTPTSVPEPATALLLTSGFGLAGLVRRRSARARLLP
jgi:hypothetical protein